MLLACEHAHLHACTCLHDAHMMPTRAHVHAHTHHARFDLCIYDKSSLTYHVPLLYRYFTMATVHAMYMHYTLPGHVSLRTCSYMSCIPHHRSTLKTHVSSGKFIIVRRAHLRLLRHPQSTLYMTHARKNHRTRHLALTHELRFAAEHLHWRPSRADF